MMADNADRARSAPQLENNDVQTTEQKMRRALGLTGRGMQATVQQRPEQARARHRFVQDGGVPVTVLNHRPDETTALRERVAELQASLENERHTHANTRRQLSEQTAAAQALQTRLAHADIAHAEALAQERRARDAAQEALAAAIQSRKPAPRPVRPDPVEPPTPAPKLEVAVAPRPRGRPRINPPKEPKPVRWWTPSFRAAKKTPSTPT